MTRQMQETFSKTADIIPFPLTSTLSTSGTNFESFLIDALENPEVEKHLKGIVEGAIMDVWVKARLSDLVRIDDPFDAIYISELQADNTDKYDTDRIMQYAKIIDLSSTISFDDEWEE